MKDKEIKKSPEAELRLEEGAKQRANANFGQRIYFSDGCRTQEIIKEIEGPNHRDGFIKVKLDATWSGFFSKNDLLGAIRTVAEETEKDLFFSED